MAYRVFKRAWWKRNPSWPNGLEPYAGGRKQTLAYVKTESEARQYCREWNEARDKAGPNPTAIRAEYEGA